MKKLKTLEQFESKDPCQCGGNCGCGGNKSVNEAKKYNFKAISKAWEYAYGEDMEDEYEGFYQEVVGKYKNKVTKEDIAKIWDEIYGEDIADEYSGFFDSIKENLEASKKLEEINKVEEVKADGYSISDDEDERMDIAEQEFYDKALELANDLKAEAYEIGGSFRGPGYEHRLMLQVKDAFKKAKLKLR